ncbi:MAG: hypothetical protein R3C28_10660 [Pirellulaceae bacterium]
MAAKRRIINQVRIQRPSFFEDQAWPMHVSLAFLAVLLIVLLSTLGELFFSFNSKDQIAFAITAVVAVYIAAAVLLSVWWPKTSNRRHSLAFCISLAFNLLLLLLSSVVYLRSPQLVVPDEVTQVDKEKEEQKIVEIDLTYESGQDRMQNELESPVEAGARSHRQRNQKKQTLAVDAAQETPDQASDSAAELAQAIPKLNRKTQASVPRLADSKGMLSKQLTSAKPNLGKPTVESFDRPETPQPTPVAADAKTLQRQTPQLAAAQMDDSAEPTSPEISPDNALTRKDQTLDAPKIASAEPTLLHQVDVPRLTPRTDVATNSTAVSANRRWPNSSHNRRREAASRRSCRCPRNRKIV